MRAVTTAFVQIVTRPGPEPFWREPVPPPRMPLGLSLEHHHFGAVIRWHIRVTVGHPYVTESSTLEHEPQLPRQVPANSLLAQLFSHRSAVLEEPSANILGERLIEWIE